MRKKSFTQMMKIRNSFFVLLLGLPEVIFGASNDSPFQTATTNISIIFYSCIALLAAMALSVIFLRAKIGQASYVDVALAVLCAVGVLGSPAIISIISSWVTTSHV